MEETPLYNTRILKNFAEYISEYHPQIDMMPILDYAGITTYQLEDDAHWLTQRQVDRFYEILVKTVGDHDLARKVGQCATLSKAAGALSQFTLGFMTPSAAYLALEKLYSHASRGSTIKTRRVSSTKVEVVAIQNPGVTEKPYQCENRLGSFESIAKLFTNELARIEHTTCMHTSGDRCIYNITWKTTPSFIWKRIANYSYLLCLIISLFLLIALPGGHSSMAILSMILVVTGISLYQVHLEKDELATSFKNHCDTSSNLLEEVNTRYNNAILVQEIGKATSMIPDIDNILSVIMKLIEKYLGFDHGMILLSDKDKTQLNYKAGFGHNPEMMTGSEEIIFHIDKPESKSAVIIAFRDQKSCLIDDINIFEGDFPDRSKNTFKHRDTNLFMCVPIVFEKESLGILIVDNAISKKALLESDMSLMTGIASQIAVSITNASYFLKMRESEERFRELAETLPETVYEADTEGTLTFVNRSTFDHFGYTPEDLAHGLNYMDLFFPEDHGRAFENFQRIVMNGDDIGLHEYILRRKDGSTFPGIINSTLVIHDGKPSGIRGFIVDITERKLAEEQLKQTLESLRKSFRTTIQVMVSAVETRDPYTSGHQTRVANIARAIATEMGLPKEKIDGLRMAGSIHDIGKLSIPSEILSKPGRLTEIEYSLIKQHAIKGYEMLKDVESPWPLAQIVYQHHEHMDGSGYPSNLKGDEILMEARILAVADVVEAMSSHRPYRAGLGIGAALNEIEKNRGIFYDNTVVDACLRLFHEKGFQLRVA